MDRPDFFASLNRRRMCRVLQQLGPYSSTVNVVHDTFEHAWPPSRSPMLATLEGGLLWSDMHTQMSSRPRTFL